MDANRSRKLIQIGCLAVFFLFLSAPTLQERLGLFDFEALKENRNREKRPADWLKLFTEGAPWSFRYEKYFNDTFGFRDQLIRIKHQLDYWIFQENDEVFVGREGWLFYKSVVQGQYYVESMRDDEYEKVVRRVEALGKALAARGITLVLVPCPLADAIYPEMLPSPVLPDQRRARQFWSWVKSKPEYVLIDATAIVMALKGELQVFHKTDFHWTDPAAARVAQQVVDRLGVLSGVGPLWDQPAETVTRLDTGGGELMAMGLLFPPPERRLFLNEALIKPVQGRVTEIVDPNTWTFESEQPADAKLIPPTVLVGDSFADSFDRAGWQRYFRRLKKFYNWHFRDHFSQIPDGTRFVIFEFVDGFLTAFANDDYWPPELRGEPGTSPSTGDERKGEQNLPASAARPSATLTADPSPVPTCPASGVGTTTISWTISGVSAVELHAGTPDGPIVAVGGSGSAVVSWAGHGTLFFLQDHGAKGPRTTESALARLEIQATTGTCPE